LRFTAITIAAACRASTSSSAVRAEQCRIKVCELLKARCLAGNHLQAALQQGEAAGQALQRTHACGVVVVVRCGVG
jgi:hypothetical protein